MNHKKRITILGCTGSIGQSTVDIIRQHPERFELVACTANTNAQALAAICAEFAPSHAALADMAAQSTLPALLDGQAVNIIDGEHALHEAVSIPCDIVVAGMVGASGVAPILSALKAGAHVALANKEALVCAGPQVMAAAKAAGRTLLPIDSEHNAAFQLWDEANKHVLSSLTLTASGGPFLNRALESFSSITPEEAVAHPNWDMGAKISVDSATMMNKALELIEAHYLFDLPPEQLDAVIHPQSLVHAFLHYHDGSSLAQMAQPDMRIPIASALAWPERLVLDVPKLTPESMGELSFLPVEAARYPLFYVGQQAMAAGQAAMIALNAANEVAVAAFLEKRIGFATIGAVVEETLQQPAPSRVSSIEEVLAWDAQSRQHAQNLLQKEHYGMAS